VERVEFDTTLDGGCQLRSRGHRWNRVELSDVTLFVKTHDEQSQFFWQPETIIGALDLPRPGRSVCPAG
jgi:hypothetical protein